MRQKELFSGPDTINSFSGKYRFLSNFYPCEVVYDGQTYPSVEHAYQAAKTLDLLQRAVIRKASTAGEAKKLGNKVDLRLDWEEVKLWIMEELVKYKFHTHSQLFIWLLNTRRARLVEGNYWGDTYWGVCKNVGSNHLGKILMRIRG